jgi:large subunit ribosomal protein L30
MAKVAAVLVRGLIGSRSEVRDTLSMLRLRKKHTCVVMENNPHTQGMLQRSKDFITFGPVADETIVALQKARKPVHEGALTVFNLAPPIGGWERKGIKKSFTQGGALGPRKEMDTLIKKMT